MSESTEADRLSAAQVAAYLAQHTDFFQAHEYLLDELTIPHPETGDAVSLLERLVQRQRERQMDLGRQLEDMLRAARDNERVVTSLHHLAMELMSCDNLDDVVATCRDIMMAEFDADCVVMRLVGRGHSQDSSLYFIDPDDRMLQQMSGLFQRRQPVCGRLRPKQQVFLFGDDSGSIKSAVLIPLFEAREIGVLALGSKHEGRFHPGMGNLFINQMGALVSRALAQHLQTNLQSMEFSGT